MGRAQGDGEVRVDDEAGARHCAGPEIQDLGLHVEVQGLPRREARRPEDACAAGQGLVGARAARVEIEAAADPWIREGHLDDAVGRDLVLEPLELSDLDHHAVALVDRPAAGLEPNEEDLPAGVHAVGVQGQHQAIQDAAVLDGEGLHGEHRDGIGGQGVLAADEQEQEGRDPPHAGPPSGGTRRVRSQISRCALSW